MSSSTSSTLDWVDRYSTALTQRAHRANIHKEYIDQYTQLADHLSTLSSPNPSDAPPSTPATTTPSTSTSTSDPTTLRLTLQSSQKARAELETTLQSLSQTHTHLTATHHSLQKRFTSLEKAHRELERKLRDRDEEIRGKDRLVQEAQDEMVALGLQLNVSEERKGVLERENKELVERWVRRMGEEVERVNRESDWR